MKLAGLVATFKLVQGATPSRPELSYREAIALPQAQPALKPSSAALAA
jgi:hypothetical protein